MNTLLLEYEPRLKILIRSERRLDECEICGARLRIEREDINHILDGRLQKFETLAKYFELLQKLINDGKGAKIDLGEFKARYNRIMSLYRELDFVVSYGSKQGRIFCQRCGTPIPVTVDVAVDHKVEGELKLDYLLRLQASQDLDWFFRRETGKTWDQLREEAMNDPKKKAEIRELLKEAGIFF
ncbi:MAG: hypothetical protein QXG35_09885 [Nitrososphaerota archaeon]